MKYYTIFSLVLLITANASSSFLSSQKEIGILGQIGTPKGSIISAENLFVEANHITIDDSNNIVFTNGEKLSYVYYSTSVGLWGRIKTGNKTALGIVIKNDKIAQYSKSEFDGKSLTGVIVGITPTLLLPINDQIEIVPSVDIGYEYANYNFISLLSSATIVDDSVSTIIGRSTYSEKTHGVFISPGLGAKLFFSKKQKLFIELSANYGFNIFTNAKKTQYRDNQLIVHGFSPVLKMGYRFMGKKSSNQ